MREWHARDEAWQRARSFARRFGEPHVRLAMHGAVPIGLTPELLHLIRVNFVAAAPWVAEADLLLSPLCRDVGGGFFEMEEELRGLLVEELQRDPDFGPGRLQAIADFLGAWADRMRESASDPEWSDFVEGQALTALSYRKPEEAAEALARSLNSPQRGRSGIDARVIKLTQGLSSALMSQVEVVTYAVALDKLAAGDVEAALEHFGALGPMDQPVKIGSVNLPAPVEWGMTEQQVEEAGGPGQAGDVAQERTRDAELIGESAAMRQVHGTIGRIAPTDDPVLIRGETGTGKGVAARAIHRASARSGKPFVGINCGALPEALLEEELFGRRGEGVMSGRRAGKGGALEGAQAGTLFLDDVDELPPGLQARLLSTLQGPEFIRLDGVLVPVNVRILAATRLDLEAPQRENKFLQDLYRRLNAANIVMPPLRERGEDVVLLAEYFASRSARKAQLPVRKIPPEVRERLLGYDWPGNVRELLNVMERAVILGSGDEVRLEDLPDAIRNAPVARGRVLIAYGSGLEADQNVAAKIAEFLNSTGYAVFEAPQDLADNSALTPMILSRIRESIAVVAVYSVKSAGGTWVRSVVELTRKENVVLLPVAVGGIPLRPAISSGISTVKHIVWAESSPESSLESLRATLDTLRSPTAPQPALAAPEFVYISCAPEDRHFGTMIREHLEGRGVRVWLDDRPDPPRRRGEPSLEFLLKPGNLMIVIVSERGASNEWLQEEVSMALELGTQILPIQIGNLGSLPPPLSRLRHRQWIVVEAASNASVFEMFAQIDRYMAAFQPLAAESTDDVYIETEASHEARRLVQSGANLIVRGSRRSGKTALLRYLGRVLREENVAIRYIDGGEIPFAPDAIFLVDEVGNLRGALDEFSRRSPSRWVLAAPAGSNLGPPYTRVLIVELQDFTLEETAEMNRRFGSPLRPKEVENVFDLLDGHPYLTRATITSVAGGRPVDTPITSRSEAFAEELRYLERELDDGDLRRAWNSLLDGARLDKPAQDSLLAVGLAKKRHGRLVPRNRLFREFFARRRRDIHTVLISSPDPDLPCARAVRTWLENRNMTVLEFAEFGALSESYDSHVEQLLERADLVVGLIAGPVGGRGNIAEIRIACERRRIEGRPKVFAVLVQRGMPPSELMDMGDAPVFRWDSDADMPRILRELAALIGEDEALAE